jgi:iron complex transport system permease protein
MSHLTAGRFALTLLAALVILAATLAIATFLDVSSDGSLAVLGFSEVDRNILLYVRLPRVLAGLVTGAGLAAAGCVYQATLRNPLADPFTLGISSGSALCAVLGIRLGVDRVLGHAGIGVCALLGATATVWLVWRLGRVGRALPPSTLLLAGVTVASLCGAASMLVQYTADFTEIHRIVRWMMGGLDAVSWSQLSWTSVAVVIGLVIVLASARHLNALSAGSDAAASLGVDVRLVTGLSLGAASLVVGATIALAGPIGFIGLLVPHMLRALIGPDHRLLVPAVTLIGGALLMLCDLLAREVLSPIELPVGVVTALLGGPFFLFLLVSEKSRARLWMS